MPRKKAASPEEVGNIAVAGTQRYVHALRTKAGGKAIKRRMRQLEQEYHSWANTLNNLNLGRKKSKRKFENTFPLDRQKVRKEFERLRLRVDDLPLLHQFFDILVANVSAEGVSSGPEPEFFAKCSRAIARLLKPPKVEPRRFKREFEQAFRLRTEARSRGKEITAQRLAEKLMPTQYQKNPESAIRSMQRGIDRVEREHQRCLKLSIPSPFLP